MRGVSNIIVSLLIIAIVIGAIAVAFSTISSYIRSHQPKGEIISSYVTGSKYRSESVVSVRISLYISCTGPKCDKYYVTWIVLRGYSEQSHVMPTLNTLDAMYRLKHGTIRIDIIGYIPPDEDMKEFVVSYILIKPNGEREVVYKSITLR